MRQLATLPNADAARTLADHLLTLRIDTQLDKQPDGWAVWVRDEDHLAQARKELEEYLRQPNDPRYSASAREAEALRREKAGAEKAYHRRQDRFNRRMSGIAGERWTLTLIIASILISVLTSSGTVPGLVQKLSIARYVISEKEISTLGLAPIWHGEIWRLVTPIFLHFGILHLLFNMYALHDLGGPIERRRGSVRYLALVLVLAVVSNLVQYFYRGPFFGGMSGVVFGLFGYIWMKARFQPEAGLSIHPSSVTYLMVWFFLCMTGLVGPIANGAHVGGLIAGMLLGYAPTVWSSPRSP